MAHISKPTQKPVALAVLALIFMQSATAQTAPEAPASSAAKKADEPQKLEAVVVSGSRIKRDNFSTPAPVTIIRNDDALAAGFSSTAQVLQSTAVTGGQGQINNAYGGFVTDGGPGSNTIGLRGFAPTRSLVLLNGRRLAPSGTRGSVGAADLNSLPNAIVDRIEVLKDGASSIYGSDAVAGVVNVITKKNLTSITVDGGLTRTQEGGGAVNNFAISGGKIWDDKRFLASYSVNQTEALTLGQRDWTRCNTDYRRTVDPVTGAAGPWGSADFIDPATGKPKCYPISGTGSNGVTINTLGTTARTGVGAPGSVPANFNRWRPNPAVTTGLVGYEGVGGGTNNLNVRDTFDPRTLNRGILSPVRTQNLYAQGGMDLGALGDAELYFELLANRRESSQTGYRQLSLDYMRGSPLIPANLAFSNFLGPQPTTNGANVGVRAFIGFGNDLSSQTVDVSRLVAGIRGAVANTGWDYDVSLTSSRSRGEYTFQQFLTNRMAQSSNVVASGSGFACVNPANGCVAAPALTPAVIGGQLPADWVNYVFQNVTGVTTYREDVVTGSVTGPLFTLPYGKVKGAFGVETRSATIDDTPGLDSQNGNLYNFSTSAITRGSDRANDLFGEVEVPLLKNLPFAQELTANASVRWANYESYGAGSTYKAGMLWSPTKSLTFRATKGTSYRAPALFEQNLGSTSGFQASSNDPCNNWDAPGNLGTTRSNNCKSEGLPAGYAVGSGNNSSIQVNAIGGKSTGLKAETSDNKTAGVIFQPELASGLGDLSLALDYFDIKVDNGVSRAGFGGILSRCYDDPQFRSGGSFCRLVSRNTTTNALTVNDSYVNLATDVVRGFEFTGRYTNDVGLGRLRVNMTVTEYREQANKLFAEDELDDVNKTIGNPNWSGALDFNYTLKGWNYFYGLEWIGKTSSYDYYGENAATSTIKVDTPSYILQSASVKYTDTVGKWSATFGVRNLADVKPPEISAQAGYNRVGNAALYSGYDYSGRRFFLNVTKTF